MEPDDLLRLIDALNPDNEAGRLTLTAASAPTRSTTRLPRLMAATKARRPQRWSGPSTRCTATR